MIEPSDTESRERAIVESLRRIIRAVDIHSRHLNNAHGLTAPQLATLQALHASGLTPVGTLARAVHLSPGTMTGIVHKLEARGLIKRTPSRTDRRSMQVRLTPKGKRLVETAPSMLQDQFRAALGNLQDWEQHMLLAALQRIAGMMNAGSLDAAPHLVVGDIVAPSTEPIPNDS